MLINERGISFLIIHSCTFCSLWSLWSPGFGKIIYLLWHPLK